MACNIDLKDITPIGSLKELQYLEIFKNDINDISCLANCENLVDLNLFYNPLYDNYKVLESMTCPLATGVLILCTGKATKQIESLQLNDKEYTATLQFGATTPSYDMEYTVDHTYPKNHITREKVEEALKQFVGDIMQVPPVFSACNVNGKRAYELARKDKEVELHAKQVRVDEIELLDFNDELKQARIRVVCGKGTYIRSLARDIGEALGSGAYLTALCRTRLGDVRIEDCHTIDNFQEWLDAQEVAPYIECVQNPPGTGKAKKKKWHGHSKSKNNSN